MFVDFVNMFADPTGFFSTAPLWLAFVLPGVITAVPVALAWWLCGCPAWEATFKGDTSIIIGVIQAIATVFWGIVVTPAFVAHGVIEGNPLIISGAFGWGAMMLISSLVPWAVTKYKERYH